MLPQVQSAYARLSQAALDALERSSNNSGSWMGGAGYSYRGLLHGTHADGLDYVPFDGYVAELHKGERVLTAEEARLITFAPELVTALTAHNAKNNAAIAATHAGTSTSDSANINASVDLHVDSGVAANSDFLQGALSQAGDKLGEIVTEKIEEYFYEKARREYR